MKPTHYKHAAYADGLLTAITDEEVAYDEGDPVRNDYREAALRAQDTFRRWAMAIKEFKGQRAFAFDCALLAIGWTDILGAESQVELARRWSCEKENVRKLVARIQKLSGLPATNGQRNETGRRHMRAARKKQLIPPP